MPLLEQKDEFNDFRPTLAKYRAALAQLEAWRVSISTTSRLRAYEMRLAEASRIAPGFVESGFALQVTVDLREIDEVISIVSSFDAPPTSAERDLLRRLVTGTEHPDDEQGSKAREAQFELMMRVFLKGRGMDVRVGDPDLTIQHGGVSYPFEAKRPGSERRFDERLRDAANQIAARGVPGLAAICLDEVLRPRGTFLRVTHRSLLGAAVHLLITDFVGRHRAAILRRVIGKNVAGILFTATVAGIEDGTALSLMGVNQHFEIVAQRGTEGHALVECLVAALQ